MSFLIEDILKHNTKKENSCNVPSNNSGDDLKRSHINQEFPIPNFSILEYTLSNRNYFYQNVPPERYNSKMNVCCDRISSNVSDLTILNNQNVYGREQLWSNYVSYPWLFGCSHMHTRRKGGQIRFTATQTEELEKQFNSHKYLSPEDRKQLADILRLSDRQVKTWFQNRRAKWRRNNQMCSARDNSDLSNSLRDNRMSEFISKNNVQF